MPAQPLHRQAIRALLASAMAAPDPGRVVHRIGLSESAARALVAVHEPLRPATGTVPFTLLFAGDTALPAELRSPLDGSAVAVRALRVERSAAAHTWVRAHNRSHRLGQGTLGAVLRPHDDPGRLFALTAGHVCGAAMGASRGDNVVFAPQGTAAAPFAGRLLDWQPNFARLTGSCEVDACIAELDPAELAAFAADRDSWPAGAATVFGDDQLRLRTRGLEITGTGFELLQARLSVADDEARTYVLRDALCWRASEATQAGDSGAPVWNADDALVAIHAGGQIVDGAAFAYATPIAPILRWASAGVVRRGEALQRAIVPVGRSVPPLPQPTPARAAHGAVDILARTMYGEARGEGAAGMTAVAHVVFNRIDARSWWGRNMVGVCHKPWQFSCWNANDPNRVRLLAVTGADPTFRSASDIAAALTQAQAAGQRSRDDPTNGATHYYAPRIVARPRWATGLQPCARIGGHDFFRGVA